MMTVSAVLVSALMGLATYAAFSTFSYIFSGTITIESPQAPFSMSATLGGASLPTPSFSKGESTDEQDNWVYTYSKNLQIGMHTMVSVDLSLLSSSSAPVSFGKAADTGGEKEIKVTKLSVACYMLTTLISGREETKDYIIRDKASPITIEISYGGAETYVSIDKLVLTITTKVVEPEPDQPSYSYRTIVDDVEKGVGNKSTEIFKFNNYPVDTAVLEIVFFDVGDSNYNLIIVSITGCYYFNEEKYNCTFSQIGSTPANGLPVNDTYVYFMSFQQVGGVTQAERIELTVVTKLAKQ